MKKSRRSDENVKYWRSHIEAYRLSGLSQREYCRQNKISYWSFNPWKRRLELNNKKLQEVPSNVIESISLENKKIEIILGDRIKISIPPGFSEETLRDVLRILGVLQ